MKSSFVIGVLLVVHEHIKHPDLYPSVYEAMDALVLVHSNLTSLDLANITCLNCSEIFNQGLIEIQDMIDLDVWDMFLSSMDITVFIKILKLRKIKIDFLFNINTAMRINRIAVAIGSDIITWSRP